MGETRSPGIHLSDVIRDMDRELVRTEDREIDDATRVQFEKGYLWEVALSKAFGEKAAERIGEIESDGVIMSPDGVVYSDDRLVIALEEYKCTAYSSNKSPADNWKWMMQVKGYCKALGITKCIFRVLHHIDIMWHPETCYGVWELVFTQTELDENWRSILNHAKTMEGKDNE